MLAACAPPGRSAHEVVSDALGQAGASTATVALAVRLYDDGDLPRETARTTVGAALASAQEAARDLATLEVPGPSASDLRDSALAAVNDATSVMVTARAVVSGDADPTIRVALEDLDRATQRLQSLEEGNS